MQISITIYHSGQYSSLFYLFFGKTQTGARPMIGRCRKQDPDIVGYRSRSQIIRRLPSDVRRILPLGYSYEETRMIGRCHGSSEDYRPVHLRCASDVSPTLGCRNEIGRILTPRYILPMRSEETTDVCFLHWHPPSIDRCPNYFLTFSEIAHRNLIGTTS